VAANPEIKGYQAGVDIKELAADPTNASLIGVNRGCWETFAAVYDCEVPVIAAVHGYCLGGGVGIAGNADIVVAADDATFGLPEVDRGALGVATHLSRLVPLHKMRAMFLMGSMVTAQQLLEWGSVERVVPRAELMDDVRLQIEEMSNLVGDLVELARDEPLRTLVEQTWRRAYNFVFRMTLDRDRTARYLEDVYARAGAEIGGAPGEQHAAEVWLLGVANRLLEERLPRQPEINFDILDETLRSEATRTDVVKSISDPARDFLLWELKQGCMTSVVNCLSPGERAAFVASNVMRIPDDDAAKALGVTPAAFKVRLSRARKKVGDYLAPRCEHVNPMNPCRCPARVGTALHKGFIGKVSGEVSLRKGAEFPYGRYGTGLGNDDVPMRDISAIYGNLPEPDPPSDFGERVLDRLAQ